MRDKLIQLKKTFDTLYWGADLSLLRKCLDERSRFIRYEILILILSGITMYITNIVARGYGFVIGLLVMFLYKWFLSNLNLVAKGETYGFLKWLLGTLIALILAFVFCDYELNIHWISMSLFDVITVFIILAVLLFLCYAPIRFESKKDSLYAKLIAMEQQQEQLQAELQVATKGELKLQAERAKTEIQKKAQKEYIDALSHEISDTRLRVAKAALEKWEQEQKKRVEAHIEEYIKL
jgi:uncharacterized protein YacL